MQHHKTGSSGVSFEEPKDSRTYVHNISATIQTEGKASESTSVVGVGSQVEQKHGRVTSH